LGGQSREPWKGALEEFSREHQVLRKGGVQARSKETREEGMNLKSKAALDGLKRRAKKIARRSLKGQFELQEWS